MNKFDNLEQTMCHELETIEQKLKTGVEMSETDLKRVDMLAHAMKSLATYKAMKEAEEWDEEGMSGRRGRGMNGRFVSRDYGPRSYSYGPDYYAGPDFYGPHYPMR